MDTFGSVVKFKLPRKSSKQYCTLFEVLEKYQRKGKITGFDMTLNTLESIFINISRGFKADSQIENEHEEN